MHPTTCANHKVHDLARTIPSMLACWDSDLHCRFANDAYRDWFGVEPSHLIGTSIRDLLGPSLFARNEPFIRGALAGEPQVFERVIPSPNGVQRLSLARYTPDVEDGKVNGFFVEVTDVSQLNAVKLLLERESGALELRRERPDAFRTRREDRRKADFIKAVQVEARAQIEAERQRRSVFLIELAHELRNALSPIALGARMVGKLKEKPELAASVEWRMIRQIQQMSDLVNDLFDLSGIEIGVLNVQRVWIDLRTVLDQAVEVATPQIEAGRQTFSYGIPDTPVPILGDGVRLLQVFSNLLSNAAKYTPVGGRIALDVETVDGAVEVTVRDTGIGFAAGKAESIFELFHQLENSVATRQGGLGIGLALVRQLVEAHDGSVSATSDGEGKGSAFVVRLPLAVESRVGPRKSH